MTASVIPVGLAERCLVDARWVGAYGIVRFAREVMPVLGDATRRGDGPHPLSPLDPIYLAWRQRRGRQDLFFSPGFAAAVGGGARQLLTVHDLIPLKMSGPGGAMKRQYMTRVVRPAMRQAGMALTVSDHVKGEICEWTGLPEASVRVVGDGCC